MEVSRRRDESTAWCPHVPLAFAVEQASLMQLNNESLLLVGGSYDEGHDGETTWEFDPTIGYWAKAPKM